METTTFGVTPPIAVGQPSQAEVKAADALMDELRRQGNFESKADTDKRKVVLSSLQEICDAFVKAVASEKEPKNEVLKRNARGKVFTYGSYLLGVFGPGSDIDTLVVAPKYCTREDYFSHFPGLLMSMAPSGAITDLTVVRDAFVPIIKFEYSGISIDLIFSRVIRQEIPPDFTLNDNNVLRGLDEPELRSVNGNRVTDQILRLVPEEATFKKALRAVKLWAQRRAIYANIVGFPGGVAWAMMVARVCQLYPKAVPSVIVNKFFLVMGKWQWPHPVLLKKVEDGPLPVRIWNPKLYKGDSFHLMPVITPAYPSMCATFNITHSSKAIIKRELERAFQITEDIMIGKRPWGDLFARHSFFTSDYKYYMIVQTTSKDKESHKIWSGFVESKVRLLVQRLEAHASVALARPFNKGYERRHKCRSLEDIALVQEGSLKYIINGEDDELDNAATQQETNGKAFASAGHVTAEELPPIKKEDGGKDVAEPEIPGIKAADVDMEQPKQEETEEQKTAEENEENKALHLAVPLEGPTALYTSTHYIGLELAPDSKSLDLSFEVEDFKNLCHQWEKYKTDLKDIVSLGVLHVKNINLPDDVFEPGEEKPKKKTKGINGKKRGPSGGNLPPAKRQAPASNMG